MVVYGVDGFGGFSGIKRYRAKARRAMRRTRRAVHDVIKAGARGNIVRAVAEVNPVVIVAKAAGLEGRKLDYARLTSGVIAPWAGVAGPAKLIGIAVPQVGGAGPAGIIASSQIKDKRIKAVGLTAYGLATAAAVAPLIGPALGISPGAMKAAQSGVGAAKAVSAASASKKSPVMQQQQFDQQVMQKQNDNVGGMLLLAAAGALYFL